MTVQHRDRLGNLPAIPPAEAELRQQLLGALCGRPWRTGALRVAIPLRAPACAPWFHCRNGAAFHLARLNGAPPPIRRRGDDFDGVDAAAALEAAEPLLADVEAALGVELEPAGLAEGPPCAVLLATLEGGADRLVLAWPRSGGVVPAPPVWAPALAGAVPLALALEFPGPRLPPHEAAGLARGDILLLAAPPYPCAVAAGDWQGRALLDPAMRQVQPVGSGILPTENAMNEQTPPAPQAEAAAAPVGGDFAVPLTIELEGMTVPLRHLQALREGAVLPLEGSGALPVLVRVSGQRLARGQLVSVGDGFGVLVAQRVED